MSRTTIAALRQFLDTVSVRGGSTLPDEQLLERFVATGDEQAFAALLQRHGPMVWHVCRRRLHDAQAAEDSFQATFLVLARKAASIRNHHAIAAWLHGVAYRLAGKSRRKQSVRDYPAPRTETRTSPEPLADLTLRELREILDEELQGLSEKHRAPLVLCYLEGKTRDEAAQELGWPLGTLKSRLERGRELLGQCLRRRGLALPAGLGFVTLAGGVSQAAVPQTLLHSTRKAVLVWVTGRTGLVSALRLAQGIMPESRLSQKLLLGLALAGALGTGLGIFSQAPGPVGARAAAAPPAQAAAQPPPAGKNRAEAPRPRTWKSLQTLRQRLLKRGDERCDAAIELGLAWVVQQQKPDGHWPLDAQQKNDAAATSLALLALLGAGHTHTDDADPYAKSVRRGLEYLEHLQAQDGGIDNLMYTHALGTQALCRAYALTGDRKLRGPAHRAVQYILTAQFSDGGWRYRPQQPGDMSASAYQIAALHCAALAGFDVPKENRAAAHQFLAACGDPAQGYRYLPAGGAATPILTAKGRLSRYYLGGTDMAKALPELAMKAMPPGGPGQIYYSLWAAPLAAYQGGPAAKEWLQKTHALLLDKQDQGKDNPANKGTWTNANEQFMLGSQLMATTFTLQILEVNCADDLVLAGTTRTLTADEIDKHWTALAADDPVTARRALWDLVGNPQKAVPSLRQQLPKPAVKSDAEPFAQLIIDLDSDRFATREQASVKLAKLGPPALSALKKALAKTLSLEARQRIERIVQNLETANQADQRRFLRMIEALELMGSPEARRLLKDLARLEPDPEVQRQAEAAVKRLTPAQTP